LSAVDPLTWAADKLGHTFKNTELLHQALRHSSLPGENYERLEFLGDRVLGLVIAEWLVADYTAEKEGALSRRHVGLVRKEALAEAARSIGLGHIIEMSTAEALGGGRANVGILSDVFEALIAALYLDGGYDAAKSMIIRLWRPLISAAPPQDAKTQLQEWSQAHWSQLPVYEEISREGPSHAPHFVVRVKVRNGEQATGEGTNKRMAEQNAAAALLLKVEKKND